MVVWCNNNNIQEYNKNNKKVKIMIYNVVMTMMCSSIAIIIVIMHPNPESRRDSNVG